MNRDQIDELMRENGIVVVGEAVYSLVQLVIEHEREACAELINSFVASGPVSEVQQRHNYAYIKAFDAIRARGQA